MLLEAWATARPVGVTRIDGVTEVAEHGVTPLLLPPGEPRAVADAIVSLLQDRGQARRLGEAGCILVEERFALSQTVEEVSWLYDRLLRMKGGRLMPLDREGLHDRDWAWAAESLVRAGLTPVGVTGHGVRLGFLARRRPALFSDILIATAVK